MSKRLLLVFLFVNSASIYFMDVWSSAPHGAEVVIALFFPIMWAIAAAFLLAFFIYDPGMTKGKLNKTLLFFCTPIPFIIYFFCLYHWDTAKTEDVYIKDGHYVKKVDYIFLERTEYWSTYNLSNADYMTDSVIYYSDAQNKIITDHYHSWNR